MSSSLDEMREAVVKVLPATLEDLKTLVAIPSVGAQPEHAADLARSADTVAEWFRLAGSPDVQIVQQGGGPAVLAHFPGPEGAPTVCLYSHHDVQPSGDEQLWTSSPWQPTERDGRLYGRGAADDKGGVGVHLAALRAFDGKPPVNVTVLIEGEEEMGSPTLATILDAHRDELAADVYVVADCGNWQEGLPTFTTSLRGVVDCVVEVRTLDHGLHSGEYGGLVPDALTSLCRLLATLHDEQGNVAVAGLVSGTAAQQLDYPEDAIRAETGILDGVQLIGSGSPVDRIWAKPSVSVIGLDTTPIASSSNTLIPSARARVSLRLAPGDTPENGRDRLIEHLTSHAPFGAQVLCENREAAAPSLIPFSGPVAEVARGAFRDAYGVEPVLGGTGGSIGMVADFQRIFPDATVLCTAVADPACRMHSNNESLSLSDWRKAALAEALLLARLGEQETSS